MSEPGIDQAIITEVAAITTFHTRVKSILLTAGADAASVTITNGDGGAIRITIKAPINTSVFFNYAGAEIDLPSGIYCSAFSGTLPFCIIGFG